MNGKRYDIAVIGGGIVGMATAMALLRMRGVSVAVVEAENSLAAHQTGNNSGVIHSGLYYRPGSLKARNCADGREALYRFCETHGVPHERCGKMVVAKELGEADALALLEQRGKENGLDGIRRLGKSEIRELEPNVEGTAGLFVPQTGIVDFKAVTRAFAVEVESAGGEIILGARMSGCKKEQGGLVVETGKGEVRCGNLVNCGGLQSDRIAKMCGIDPGVKIVPFKGEYYELVEQRRSLVRGLVYPMPDPRFPFLGVHFTRKISGGVEAGPNAVLALGRECYGRFEASFEDMASYLFYAGFWRMAFKYWRTGFGEIWRSFSKRAFVRALKSLVPAIETADIERAGAGIRAQAVEPDGSLCDDFRIEQAERMIHVLNAPSPAATASISIGRTVAEMAEKAFDLDQFRSST